MFIENSRDCKESGKTCGFDHPSSFLSLHFSYLSTIDLTTHRRADGGELLLRVLYVCWEGARLTVGELTPHSTAHRLQSVYLYTYIYIYTWWCIYDILHIWRIDVYLFFQLAGIFSHFSVSEVRMDDLALHDDFSEQNLSWNDSGTIISDT